MNEGQNYLHEVVEVKKTTTVVGRVQAMGREREREGVRGWGVTSNLFIL